MGKCLISSVIAATSLAAMLAFTPSRAHAAEENQPIALYWTTDRAVDRLDVAHMARSLRARTRTDEEFALAIWEYVRRTIYHYRMRNENHDDQFDAAKLINVYGYSFCTQQGVTAAAIAQAGGLEARVIGVPGHGMYEVKYDGGWHAFCTTSGFFVRTRAEDRHTASMEELKADPTLITTAPEEERTSNPFLPCAGGRKIFSEPEGTDELSYALTYRHYGEKFFVEAVKKWKSLGEPNPSRYSAWVPLRPGESLRLDWDASGSFVEPKETPERHMPPRHVCGERDRANPFFDQIAPYVKEFSSATIYRYYGSGKQVWRPALVGREALSQLARAENVSINDGKLMPADKDVRAVAEFKMSGPYVYVGGSVKGKADVAKGASLKISVQGQYKGDSWQELYSALEGAKAFDLDLGNLVKPNPKKGRKYTHYRFHLRLEMTGDAAVSDLVITGLVQHNWTALPQLVPGENTIEVRAQCADGSKLTSLADKGTFFELVWDEEGKTRTLKQHLKKPTERFTVNVKSATLPRMRYVVLGRQQEESSS